MPDWTRPLFRRVAIPRLPGSTAVRDAEAAIQERLAALGYRVHRQQFVATAAGLAAVAVLGAGLGWTALVALPLLVLPVSGWPATLVIWGALGAVGLLALGIARGHLPAGAEPVEAVNLVARRGDTEPAVWLVAHVDSKAQGASLAARVVGLPLAVVGGWGLAALGLWRWVGPAPWEVAVPVVVAGLVGGAVLSRSRPGNTSSGAVDNASGVVAALVAAERLADRADVGVLITGAEEFSMAGARAWAATTGRSGPFINFDGIDSRGAYRVMLHAAPTNRHRSKRLAVSLTRGLEAGGGVRVGRLPTGILVDGVVLARAGMWGVTVSRGDWRTLRVVHTARDRPERVDVTAAVRAGGAAAAAVRDVPVDGFFAAE